MIQLIKQSFTVIILSAFLFALQLFAFTEPSSPPPLGNVPAPLNVSSSGQSKSGGLILNTGGAANGLIVDQGNVGIGTQSPTQKLDVIGYVRGATGLCIGSDCRSSWPSGGSGGTIASLSAGSGISLSPNPITTSGTISIVHGKQLFTSNGTFTVPEGVTTVWVSMSGGGGGGGGGNGACTLSFRGGGGGGAAAILASQVTVTPLSSYPVTVGGGGAGGGPNCGAGGNGATGGISSFGTLLRENGGAGGHGGDVSGGPIGGAAGGSGGAPGGSGNSLSAGNGGGSLFGGGFGGIGDTGGGDAGGGGGGGYGGGGGGGYTGGTGSPGFVLVEW